jgi:acyl-CoA synthetase (AMP-forming)/AMP-acid ligase II
MNTSNDGCSTLVTLLRRRAQGRPRQKLYTFLGSREEETAALTYAELDHEARKLGAWLQNLGAQGERVLLLYPPGLDFITSFFACLYAGAIAVPAYPPRMNRNTLRLQAIICDAQPAFVMTTTSSLSGVRQMLSEIANLGRIQILLSDQAESHTADGWEYPIISEVTPAFLQYTSGSTSSPKGVMLSHSNLLSNLSLIKNAIDCTPESQFVSWLPPYHDMGMIAAILEPLYAGASAVLMSPTTFLQRPLCWLRTISRYRATVSGGPNFAYDLCMRKTRPEQLMNVDLSCWKTAFTGAEPVRADTLARFYEAFAPYGFRAQAFYPCYGLAEGTLFVTGGQNDEIPVVKTFQASGLENNLAIVLDNGHSGGRPLVGCGTNLPGQRIAIVKPDDLTECLQGEIGEVWVSGPSVAQGYWERPLETEQTFRAFLASTHEGPFLRTGDLGFIHDNQLFITGRLKDLIIVDGQNHYPQDIELTVEKSHPAIRPSCCAAFAVELGGRERLVVVVEIERQYRTLNQDEIIKTVRQAVAEQHELLVERVLVIKPGSLPKTSSGKIQRYACRSDFLAILADEPCQ